MLVIWLLINFQPFQNLGKLKLEERNWKKGIETNVTFLSLNSNYYKFSPCDVNRNHLGNMRIYFMITRD